MSDAGGDHDLIALVRAGNKEAFDTLVEKYQYKITKLIVRYVNDPSEAYDIAQESFLKAFNGIDKFRGDSAFYTWLYRIAINTAKNHAVSNGRIPTNHNVEDLDVQHMVNRVHFKEYGTPERILQSDELEKVVIAVIDQLPQDLKTTITLRELEGLTYDEISHVMDCPIGTVRSRIFRAREAIERRIKPILHGGGNNER